jgi:hypothetical protein
MAIPHHTYPIMKMPAPNRILSVLGDIMVSYNCESSTVELAKDSACKAAAMVMVAQAAKIDQTTLVVPEQKRTTTTLDPSPAMKKLPWPVRHVHGSHQWGQPRPQIGTRSQQFP